jgi:pimeloyl-ACP methyl ester carboxylesterase
MSLGGLTTIRLAAAHPDLVDKAVIVDVSPGVGDRLPGMTDEQRGSTQLVGGPRTFPTFEHLVEATAKASGRDADGVWRGARLNARPLEDGTWAWRYDQLRRDGADPIDFTPLWDDVSAAAAPFMLVRGALSAHVHDDDVVEYRRRKPGMRVEMVAGAGHSVQGAKPLVLAALVEDYVFT